MANENENYSMEARYSFEVDENSLKGMRSVLGGLQSIEAQTRSTAKAASSSGLGKQYAVAAAQMARGMAGADKKIDSVNRSTRTVTQALRPMKEQLRAIKAEARLIEFGGMNDIRQFKRATRSLEDYKNEVKAIRKEVQVTTQAEREFSAVLKNQEQIFAKRIQMAKAQRQAAIAAEKKGKALGVAATGAAVAAPIAALGRKGTGLLVDYGDALSETQAITRATDEQMRVIDKQAKRMGATTRFTSAQSAKAMTYLGMAGFKTQEILDSAGDTLNLAAAGHLELANAADIGSNVLSGFHLKAKEMVRVVDVMAKVATTANTSVAQMGEAMAYAAPAASMFGASLEEASAMVGIGGNIGIQASAAGTALRAGFINLAKADKQAKVREVFGVEVVDQLTHANRNIIDIIGDIKKSMDVDFRDPQFIKDLQGIQDRMDSGELGPDAYDQQIAMLRQKYPQYSTALAGLADIFGKTAVSFWAGQITQYEQLTHDSVQAMAAGVDPDILTKALKQSGLQIKQNEDVFDAVLRVAPDYQGAANIIDRATKQLIASGQAGEGAATAMAKKMEDNLGGSFRSLNSAVEYMMLNVMEPLVPILRATADGIAWAARQIGALPAPVRTAIAVAAGLAVVIGSLVAVAGAAGVAMFGFQQYLATTSIAMQVMSKAALPLTGFFATAMKAFSLQGMLGAMGAIASFVGPILLVAGAVMAVVVAVKLLRQHGQDLAVQFANFISRTIALVHGLQVQFTVAGTLLESRWRLAIARMMDPLVSFLLFARKVGYLLISALAENSPGPIRTIREKWAQFGSWLKDHWWDVLVTLAAFTDAVAREMGLGLAIDLVVSGITRLRKHADEMAVAYSNAISRVMASVEGLYYKFAGIGLIQNKWYLLLANLMGYVWKFLLFARKVGYLLISALAENSPGPIREIREKWAEFLGTWLKNHWKGALQTLVYIAGTAAAAIALTFITGLSGIPVFFLSLFAGAWLSNGIRAIADNFTLLNAGAQSAADSIKSSMGRVGGWIKENWKAITEDLVYTATAAGTAMALAMATGLGGFPILVASLFAGKFVSQGVMAVINNFESIKTAVSGVVDHVTTEFWELRNVVSFYAESAFNSIKHAAFALFERRAEIAVFYELVLHRIESVRVAINAMKDAAIEFGDRITGGGVSWLIKAVGILIEQSLILRIVLGTVFKILFFHSALLIAADAFIVLTWSMQKFQNLVARFKPDWAAKMDPLVNVLARIRDAVTQLNDWVNVILKNLITGHFVNAALQIEMTWGAAVSSIGNLLKGWVDWARTVATQLINALNHNPTERIPAAWDKAVAFITNRIGDIVSFAQWAGQQIVGGFQSGLSAITNFFVLIPSRLEQVQVQIQETAASLKEWYDTSPLVASLKEQLSAFQGYATKLAGQIAYVLTHPGESLAAATEAMKTGAINAAQAALQAVRTAIVETARAAIASVGVTGAAAIGVAILSLFGIQASLAGTVPLAVMAVARMLPLMLAAISASGAFKKVDTFLQNRINALTSQLFGEDKLWVQQLKKGLENVKQFIYDILDFISQIIPEGGIWFLLGVGIQTFLQGFGQAIEVAQGIARKIGPYVKAVSDWIRGIRWDIEGLKTAAQQAVKAIAKYGGQFLDSFGPIGTAIKEGLISFKDFVGGIYKILAPGVKWLTQTILMPFIRALTRIAKLIGELPIVQTLLQNIGTALKAVMDSPLVRPLISLGGAAIAKVALGLMTGAQAAKTRARADIQKVRSAVDVVAPVISKKLDFALKVLMEISRGVWSGVSSTYKAFVKLPWYLSFFQGMFGRLLAAISPFGLLYKATMGKQKFSIYDLFGLDEFSKRQKVSQVMAANPTRAFLAAGKEGPEAQARYIAEFAAQLNGMNGVLANARKAFLGNQMAAMIFGRQLAVIAVAGTSVVTVILAIIGALYIFKPEIFQQVWTGIKAIGDVLVGLLYIITHIGRTVEASMVPVPFKEAGQAFYELRILNQSLRVPKWAAYLTKALNVIVAGLKFVILAWVAVIDIASRAVGWIMKTFAIIALVLTKGMAVGLNWIKATIEWLYMASDKLFYAIEMSWVTRDWTLGPVRQLFWRELFVPIRDGFINSVRTGIDRAIAYVQQKWTDLGNWVSRQGGIREAIGSLFEGEPGEGKGFFERLKFLKDILFGLLNPINWVKAALASLGIAGGSKLLTFWSGLEGIGLGVANAFGAVATAVAFLVQEYMTGYPHIRMWIQALGDWSSWLDTFSQKLADFITTPYKPFDDFFQMIVDGWDKFGGGIRALIPILLGAFFVFKIIAGKKGGGGIFGGIFSAITDVIGLFTKLVVAIVRASKAMFGFGRSARESFESYDGALGYTTQTGGLYTAGYVPEPGTRKIAGIGLPTRGRRVSNESENVQALLLEQFRVEEKAGRFLIELRKEQRRQYQKSLAAAKAEAGRMIEQMPRSEREKFTRGSRINVSGKYEFEQGRFGRLIPTRAGQAALMENARARTMSQMFEKDGKKLSELAKRVGYTQSLEDMVNYGDPGFGQPPSARELKKVASLAVGPPSSRGVVADEVKGWAATALQGAREVTINAQNANVVTKSAIYQQRQLDTRQGQDKLLSVPITRDQIMDWAKRSPTAGMTTEGQALETVIRKIEDYFTQNPQLQPTVGSTPKELFAQLMRELGVEHPFTPKLTGSGEIASSNIGNYAIFEKRDKMAALLALLEKTEMMDKTWPISTLSGQGMPDIVVPIEPLSSHEIETKLKQIVETVKRDLRTQNLSNKPNDARNALEQALITQFPLIQYDNTFLDSATDVLTRKSQPHQWASQVTAPLQSKMLNEILDQNPVIQVLNGFEEAAAAAMEEAEKAIGQRKKKGIWQKAGDLIMRSPLGGIVDNIRTALSPRRSVTGAQLTKKRAQRMSEIIQAGGYTQTGERPLQDTKKGQEYIYKILQDAGKATPEAMLMDSIARSAANEDNYSDFLTGVVHTISTTPDRDMGSYDNVFRSLKLSQVDQAKKDFPKEAYDQIVKYAEGRGYSGESGRIEFFNLLKRGLIDIPGLERGEFYDARKSSTPPIPKNEKQAKWFEIFWKPRRKKQTGAYTLPNFGENLRTILAQEVKLGDLRPGVSDYKAVVGQYSQQIGILRRLATSKEPTQELAELEAISPDMVKALRAAAQQQEGDQSAFGIQKLFSGVTRSTASEPIFNILRKKGAIPELTGQENIKKFLEKSNAGKNSTTLTMLYPLLQGRYGKIPNDVYASILREIARANDIEMDELIDPTLMQSELREARQLRVNKLLKMANVATEEAFREKLGIDEEVFNKLISGKFYKLDKTPQMIGKIAQDLGVRSGDDLERMLSSSALLEEYDTLGRRLVKAALFIPKTALRITGIAGLAEQQNYKRSLKKTIAELDTRIKLRETADERAMEEARRDRELGLQSILVRMGKSDMALAQELTEAGGLSEVLSSYIKTGKWNIEIHRTRRQQIKGAMGLQGNQLEDLAKKIKNTGQTDRVLEFFTRQNEFTYDMISQSALKAFSDLGIKSDYDSLKQLAKDLQKEGYLDTVKYFLKNQTWIQEASYEQKEAIAKALELRSADLSSLDLLAPNNKFERAILAFRSGLLNLDKVVKESLDAVERIPVLGKMTRRIRPQIEAAVKNTVDTYQSVTKEIAGLPGIKSLIQIGKEYRKTKTGTLQGMYQKAGLSSLPEFMAEMRAELGRQGVEKADIETELLSLLRGEAMKARGDNNEQMLRGQTMNALREVLRLNEKEIGQLEAGSYSTEAAQPFLFFLGERAPRLLFEFARDLTASTFTLMRKSAQSVIAVGLRAFGAKIGAPLSLLSIGVGNMTANLVNRMRLAFPNNQALESLENWFRRLGRDGAQWVQRKSQIIADSRKTFLDKALDKALQGLGSAWSMLTASINNIANRFNRETDNANRTRFGWIGRLFGNLKERLMGLLPGRRGAGPSLRERVTTRATEFGQRRVDQLRGRAAALKGYRAKTMADLLEQRGPESIPLPDGKGIWLRRPEPVFKKAQKTGFGQMQQFESIPANEITPLQERLKESIGHWVGGLIDNTIRRFETPPDGVQPKSGFWSRISGQVRQWFSRLFSGPSTPPPPPKGRVMGFWQKRDEDRRSRSKAMQRQAQRGYQAAEGTGKAPLTSLMHQMAGGQDISTLDVFKAAGRSFLQTGRNVMVDAANRVRTAWGRTTQSILGLWGRMKAISVNVGRWLVNRLNHGAADTVRTAWDRTEESFVESTDHMVHQSAKAGQQISQNLNPKQKKGPGMLMRGGQGVLGGLGGIARTGMLAGSAFMGLGFGAQQIASSLQTMGLVDDQTSEAIYKFTEMFSLISGIGAVLAPVLGLVGSALGTIITLGGGLLTLLVGLGGAFVTFILSPIGLITAAVIGTLFLINEVLKRTLGIDVLGPLFGGIKTMAWDTVMSIGAAFSWAADWVTLAWEGFRDKFWPILQPIVQPALDIAQQLINALNHNPTEVIPESWRGAVENIVAWLQGLPVVGQLIAGDLIKYFDPALILGKLIEGFGWVYEKMAGFFGYKGDNPLSGMLEGFENMRGQGLKPEDLVPSDVREVLNDTAKSLKKVGDNKEALASLQDITLKSWTISSADPNMYGPAGLQQNILTQGEIKETLKTAPALLGTHMRAAAAKEKLTGGRTLVGGGIGDQRRLAEAKYSTQLARIDRAQDIVAHKRDYDATTVGQAQVLLAHRRQEENRIRQAARKELGAIQLGDKQQDFLMKMGIDPDAVEAGINKLMSPVQDLAWAWKDRMSAMKRSGNDFWKVASSDFKDLGRGIRGLSKDFIGSSLIILGALGSLILTMITFGVSSIIAMGPVGIAIAGLAIAILALSIKTFGLKGTFQILWNTAKTAFSVIKAILESIAWTYTRISNGVTILGNLMKLAVTKPKEAWLELIGILKNVLQKVKQVMGALGGATVDRVKGKVQADLQRVTAARQGAAQGQGVRGKAKGFFRGLFSKPATNEALPDVPPTPAAAGRTGSVGGTSPALKEAGSLAARTKKHFSDLSDVTLTLAAAFGPLAPAIAGPLFIMTSLMDGVLSVVEGIPILKGIAKDMAPVLQNLGAKFMTGLNQIGNAFNTHLLPVMQKMWSGITTQILPAVKSWVMGNKMLMGAFGAVKGAFLTHVWPIMAKMWGFVAANVLAPIGAWIASMFGLSASSATAGATATASNVAIAASTAGAAAVAVPANTTIATSFGIVGKAAGIAWGAVLWPIALVVGAIFLVIGAIWLLAKRFKWIGKLFSPITKIINLFWRNIQQVMDDIKRMVNLAFIDELSKIWNQLRELGHIILKPFEPLFNLLGIKGGGSSGGILGRAIYAMVQVLLVPVRLLALALIGVLKIVSFIIQAFIFIGKVIATIIVTPIMWMQELASMIWESLRNIQKMMTAPWVNTLARIGSWFMNGRERREQRTRGYAKGGYVSYGTGGMVRGGGSSVSDSIQAWLSNGEFVMPTAVTRQNRSVLDLMRSGTPVEAILRALPVAPPTVPRELLERGGVATAEAPPANQEININITFGDIIVGNGSSQEQAQEFVQSVEPQIQRAIADALRDLLEKTR